MSNEIVTVMDHNNTSMLRVCYRHIGTVIVRFKMEVSRVCCRRDVCPTTERSESMHRLTACEQCTRTRLLSQYSDCDSDVMDKSRPYRSSAARSRYVKYCAAVCLLLLVGGIPTKSSAAPPRNSAAMQRQRRSTGDDSYLWENPCDYVASNKINVPDPKEVAPKLIAQAKSALESTAKYKNTFASLHSYQNFDKLVADWEGTEWLRTFSFPKDILPKEKVLNKNLPDEYLNNVMANVDEFLPSMYNGLQMIVRGLNEFSKKGLNANIISDENLKTSVNQTMTDVRAVLCYFNNIIKGRKLDIPQLKDSISFTENGNMLQDGLLVYRDTLNYLEYLLQIFQKLY